MTLRDLLIRIGLLDPKPDGIELAAHLATDRGGHVSRRAFLGLVATTLVAANIDPEKLIWSPDEQVTIALPELGLAPIDYVAGGAEYPHAFLSADWITKEVAKHFRNNLRFITEVQQSYDQRYLRLGDTVRVRVPQRYVVRAQDDVIAPPQDNIRPVTLTDQLTVTEGVSGRHADHPDPEAIGKALARDANRKRLNVFGTLELPASVSSGTVVTGHGVSVRMIEQYDFDTNLTLRRFDILGGAVRET